jgi:hypothetical protein
MFFHFKKWLESSEFYDKTYRQKVDDLHQQNPKVFSHFFPEGQNRLYLPFSINGDGYKNNKEINNSVLTRENISEILTKNGYSLIDFRKGLASPHNLPKRRQRLVPTLIHIQEIYRKFNSDTGNFFVVKITKLIDKYQKLPIRLNPGDNEFLIAISQDPHDIAKMSYDRSWKQSSCMRLPDDKDEKGGEQHDQVFDEIKEGGLIAYLIDPEDKEIRKPYARVLIRRFSDSSGVHIGLCEENIYGLEFKEFLRSVKDFIEQKSSGKFGTFHRYGSAWSDSFGDEHRRVPDEKDMKPENQEAIFHYLENISNNNEFFRKIQEVLSYHRNFDSKFIKKVFSLFEKHPQLTFGGEKQYYDLPILAMNYDVPVEHLKYLFNSYPDRILKNFKKNDDELVDYVFPAIKQMIHHLLVPENLVFPINHFKKLQDRNFIFHIPYHALDYLKNRVTVPEVKEAIEERIGY